MTQGKLRKFFPGGNTSQGFFSYYDNIIAPDATRIFCIKGGPGVGKSTLMRSIGETMLAKGYDVEYHCCSSDNGSLDGVCIPSIGVVLLDGTAPHIVDPKNPGAVDEVVNLGEFWNEDLMVKNKEAILATNRKVGKLFAMAYFSLKEAGLIINEWKSYITPAMNFGQVNKDTATISQELFGALTPNFSETPKSRHLFATAITPNGPQTHLDSILQDVTTLYTVKGEPGTGKATLLENIAKKAQLYGLYTEVYHRPLSPESIDGVVIPEISAAVVNISAPVNFNPQCLEGLKTLKEFNLTTYLDKQLLTPFADEIKECQERFDATLNRAASRISRAKAEHDILETYYVPAMDFAAINAKKEEILARVLKYAKMVKNS